MFYLLVLFVWEEEFATGPRGLLLLSDVRTHKRLLPLLSSGTSFVIQDRDRSAGPGRRRRRRSVCLPLKGSNLIKRGRAVKRRRTSSSSSSSSSDRINQVTEGAGTAYQRSQGEQGEEGPISRRLSGKRCQQRGVHTRWWWTRHIAPRPFHFQEVCYDARIPA